MVSKSSINSDKEMFMKKMAKIFKHSQPRPESGQRGREQPKDRDSDSQTK